MDLNLVDPELALALEKFPPGDLWTDLNKSRQLIAQDACATYGAITAG